MADKTIRELSSPGSAPAVGSPRDEELLADEELLDWDAALEAPPCRPGGRMKVSLTYAGRSKPIEADESWD
jgi:hypothetical protein